MGKWETFVVEGKTVVPKLTIRKGGQIGLNMAAVQRFSLKKYKYVIFRINQDEQKLGLKFSNDEKERGIRKVRIVQGGISLAAKSFVLSYSLDQIKEKRLICEWDQAEEMVIAKYTK